MPPAVDLVASHLYERDALWFIDNTAALTAPVKGGDNLFGSNEMVHIAALALAKLRCWCWYELVPSKSNPADPLFA